MKNKEFFVKGCNANTDTVQMLLNQVLSFQLNIKTTQRHSPLMSMQIFSDRDVRYKMKNFYVFGGLCLEVFKNIHWGPHVGRPLESPLPKSLNSGLGCNQLAIKLTSFFFPPVVLLISYIVVIQICAFSGRKK